MDDERRHLQREIERFTALLAVLTRHAPDADDLVALLRENIEIRCGWLAEPLAQHKRMH